MFAFEIYSQEEEIFHPLFKEKEVRVFLKRDDMIHPFISGNKWRKLKYNLINASEENKDHLITFGGVWSNHLLATACAAAKFGFKATAFVRGEDIASETLFLCRMFGMELKFTERDAYRNKRLLFDTFYSNDSSAFFIDEGGAGAEAVQGCSELVTELKGNYQHVFCAAGTGTTAAGILKGLLINNSRALLHVVPVLKGAEFLKEEINKYFIDNPLYELHNSYHFGGYAKTQPDLLNFISDFSASTGILADQVYTGKMMYGVFDLITHDYFPSGTNILAVHTGGLFGLLGLKEKMTFKTQSGH
ncbi:1-aminocyclopropane-1-carboxylate deaminase/D-cysteine desulfhydrase [Arcticibacter tournemirensis]|uniref:Pyridoxal-phosphate dependent enzyme n=1 Tax=Arcticibacter tournemirensis TaxID=699437 RepID=A0A4Q0MC07_9SPHI|nr:pyridoxal-phosphate dependent enzyme [Arcticibacter tournemirensis]RXF70714.1 pyridoxal-phosphate dependent enzyme [Arcticibacter tournemirensis]